MSRSASFSWDLVDRKGAEECWLWRASLNTHGYGQCTHDGVSMNASRAAFIVHNGWIGPGLVVCHRCDNPACCNPKHLFAATQAVNLADCREKGRQSYRTGANHHRPTAKLNEEMVAEAKRLYSGGISQTEIGRRLGVHSSTISRAVRGDRWGHLA